MLIEINAIDLSKKKELNWNNFSKNPFGLILCLCIITICIIVCYILPKVDDVPFIEKYQNLNPKLLNPIEYRAYFDRKILENSDDTMFQKLIKLSWNSLRNEHEIISLCFRQKGTGITKILYYKQHRFKNTCWYDL